MNKTAQLVIRMYASTLEEIKALHSPHKEETTLSSFIRQIIKLGLEAYKSKL